MATDGRLESYKENEFPNLLTTGYRITSPVSRAYDCFAWAAGECDRWWNPLESENPYYWMEGVPAELTLTAFIQVFKPMACLALRPARVQNSKRDLKRSLCMQHQTENQLMQRGSYQTASGRANWGAGKT
jgi:hypothetical protein